MRNSQEKKFLDFLERDIKILEESMLNKEEPVNKIFIYIRNTIPFFTIDYAYFIELLSKYCFLIPKEQKVEINDVPEVAERFSLFQEILIEDHKKNEFFTKISLYIRESQSGGMLTQPILLFFNFYYATFMEYISSGMDIREIFHKFKREWFNSLESKRLNINIIIHSPIFSIVGEHQIAKGIKLISARPPIKIIKNPNQSRKYQDYISSYYLFGHNALDYSKNAESLDSENLTTMRLFMIFETEIPYYCHDDFSQYEGLYRKTLNDKSMIEEYVKEFISCLYLIEKDFEYKGFIIKYPWWFITDINRFDKFDEPIHRAVFVSNEEIEDLKILYQKVREVGIFKTPDFEIVKYRYFQIFNNRTIQDLLLDYFIILEFFFTRKSSAELRFRLSLNAALFLSSDWNFFSNYYRLFGDLYKLRSTIIHGSNVNDKVKKIIKKYSYKDHYHFLHQIKVLLNVIISKFVNLMLDNSQFLKDLENPLYFLKNSQLTIN